MTAVASGFHRPRRFQRVGPGQVQPRRGPGAGRGDGPVRPLPQILRPTGCGGGGWSPHRQGGADDGRGAVRGCLSRLVPCLVGQRPASRAYFSLMAVPTSEVGYGGGEKGGHTSPGSLGVGVCARKKNSNVEGKLRSAN